MCARRKRTRNYTTHAHGAKVKVCAHTPPHAQPYNAPAHALPNEAINREISLVFHALSINDGDEDKARLLGWGLDSRTHTHGIFTIFPIVVVVLVVCVRVNV